MKTLLEGSCDDAIRDRTYQPNTCLYLRKRLLRKAAGVPFLRIHDLRHQYASFLVNSGRTLYEVQQILGHADSSVTQRYAHLTSETLQDAANSASVAIQAATTTNLVIGI